MSFCGSSAARRSGDVERSEGAVRSVDPDLAASGPDILHRFPVVRIEPLLGPAELVAEIVLCGGGQIAQVVECATHPSDRFLVTSVHLPRLYQYEYMLLCEVEARRCCASLKVTASLRLTTMRCENAPLGGGERGRGGRGDGVVVRLTRWWSG